MTDPMSLGQWASAAQDSRAVAACSIDEWRRIEEVLAPVIGQAGFRAVYAHSLALGRKAMPWLPAAVREGPGAISFAPLQAALAERPVLECSAADDALRQVFREVLASLIGGGLTARLLTRPRGAGQPGTAADEMHFTP